MARYAKIVNGLVVDVIVASEDYFIDLVEDSPGEWLQTSYNTIGGIHYENNTNTPSGLPGLRFNFAGIGDIYDEFLDAFYKPKPYSSWLLDTGTCVWKPPVEKPQQEVLEDGSVDIRYNWDESTASWVETTGVTNE